MKTTNYLVMSLSFLIMCGCSSTSIKERTLTSMAAGAVVGGLIGGLTVPAGEKSVPHIALWAGIGSTIAGAGSLVLLDEEKVNKERNRQIQALHNEVAALRGESTSSSNEVELFSSQRTLERDVPKEFKNLIRPGSWTIYAVDQWVNGGENMKIHQDKIIKLEPPQMNVGSN